jgi:D-alanyl-D-alanine carboxypeptidase (penicillin-binding protein 5/6)
MISTLISLYAAGSLIGGDVTANNSQHTMPWNETVQLEATRVPEKNPANIEPVIDAESAIAVDLKNGIILYEKNIHEKLPIASLTKLMTVVVILEENNIRDTATISYLVTKIPGSKIWLAEGEKITIENLLYASLINSANDAATALAQYNSDNIDIFVEKMNQKSKELGLTSTLFINPTGLDEEMDAKDPRIQDYKKKSAYIVEPEDENGLTTVTNSSTAYDLALLGRYAYGKSFVRRAVVKKELEIASNNEFLRHNLKNTNDLLDSYLKVLGLKTGTTDVAGECLIAIVENESGDIILTVVLNSKQRYTETKILADWVFRSYTWS